MSESWDLIKDTASRWLAHKDARLGAALAYYSVFSLGPLIVIAIAVAGLVLGQEAVRGEVGSADPFSRRRHRRTSAAYDRAPWHCPHFPAWRTFSADERNRKSACRPPYAHEQ